MASGNQQSRALFIWLGALSLAVLALMIAAVIANGRLTEAERGGADLAARLTETASATAKADARIAALEKTAADAKADRDALREALRKAAADEASAEAAAAPRLMSLEAATAESKSVQEALRDAEQKTSAAVEAVKSTLDRTDAIVAAAGQDAAQLATRVEALKTQQDQMKQDGDKLAQTVAANAAATAALRSSFAWRELSADARSRLTAALEKAGANGLNLVYMAHDSEAHRFAMDFGKTFKTAGWQVNYVAAAYPGVLITGILLQNAGNQATQDVEAALKASGLDVLTTDIPRPSESFGGSEEGNPVTLVIGAHALY